MEDVYRNLDNYEEDNILKQLRLENTELKDKIEEINKAMTHLQTEHDNLKLEFKKVQTNFSSLFKTAKAEIKRKTQLISALNLEKDKLIIKYLNDSTNNYKVRQNHNGDKPHPAFNKDHLNPSFESGKYESNDSASFKGSKDRSPCISERNVIATNKIHKSNIPSITNSQNKLDEDFTYKNKNINEKYAKDEVDLSKMNRRTCDDTSLKENALETKTGQDCSDVNSHIDMRTAETTDKHKLINNRRKSIADLSKRFTSPQFSSDAENDDDSPGNENNRNNRLYNEDKPKEYPKKYPYYEDKFSSDKLHRNSNYNHRLNKNLDDEYPRSKNRFDSYNKIRKRSPVETLNRYQRSRAQHRDNRSTRIEHGRNRILESPKRTKSREHKSHDSDYYHRDRHKSSTALKHQLEIEEHKDMLNNKTSKYHKHKLEIEEHEDMLNQKTSNYHKHKLEIEDMVDNKTSNAHKNKLEIKEYEDKRSKAHQQEIEDHEIFLNNKSSKPINKPKLEIAEYKDISNNKTSQQTSKALKHKLEIEEHEDILSKNKRLKPSDSIANSNENISMEINKENFKSINDQINTNNVFKEVLVSNSTSILELEEEAIKKILHEDPRLTSKKYIELVDSKNKVSLSLAVVKDIELKCLHYDDNVQDNDTILRSSIDLNEDYLNNIYRDIDNEILNMSVESGEIIDFCDERNATENSLPKSKSCENRFALSSEIGKTHVTLTSAQHQQSSSNDNIVGTSIYNYKIPKIKSNPTDLTNKSDNKNNFSPINDSLVKDIALESKKETNIDFKVKEPKQAVNIQECVPITDEQSEGKLCLNTKILQSNHIEQIINIHHATSDTIEGPSTRQSVADDLALSDENSDYYECTNSSISYSASIEKSSHETKNTSKSKEDLKTDIITSHLDYKQIKNCEVNLPELCNDMGLITPEDLNISVPVESKTHCILNHINDALTPVDKVMNVQKKPNLIIAENMKEKDHCTDSKNKMSNNETDSNIFENCSKGNEVHHLKNICVGDNQQNLCPESTSTHIANQSDQGDVMATSTPIKSLGTDKPYMEAQVSKHVTENKLHLESGKIDNLAPAKSTSIKQIDDIQCPATDSNKTTPDIRIVVKRRRTIFRKSTGQ